MTNVNSKIKSRYNRYSKRIKSRNSAFVRNGKICDVRHVAFGGSSFDSRTQFSFNPDLIQSQAA